MTSKKNPSFTPVQLIANEMAVATWFYMHIGETENVKKKKENKFSYISFFSLQKA